MVKWHAGIQIKYLIFFSVNVLFWWIILSYVVQIHTHTNISDPQSFILSEYWWNSVNFCPKKCLKLSKGKVINFPPTHKPLQFPHKPPIIRNPSLMQRNSYISSKASVSKYSRLVTVNIQMCQRLHPRVLKLSDGYRTAKSHSFVTFLSIPSSSALCPS